MKAADVVGPAITGKKRDLRLGRLARYPDAIPRDRPVRLDRTQASAYVVIPLASLGKAYLSAMAEAYPQSACLLRMLTTHS